MISICGGGSIPGEAGKRSVLADNEEEEFIVEAITVQFRVSFFLFSRITHLF